MVASAVENDEKAQTAWKANCAIQSDGTFDLGGMPKGPLQFIAICNGFFTKSSSEDKVGVNPQVFPEDVKMPVELSMIPAGKITVHVRDTAGKPLAKAFVSYGVFQSFSIGYNRSSGQPFGIPLDSRKSLLLSENSVSADPPSESAARDAFCVATTNEQGEAVLEGIPSRKRDLLVTCAYYHAVYKELHLKGGESVSMDVVMEPVKQPSLPVPIVSKDNTKPALENPLGQQLIDASKRDDLIEMQRLISAGADVNYRGVEGSIPIMAAVKENKPSAIKLLLKNGADPAPGVFFSVHKSSRELVQLFIDHKVNLKNVTYGYPSLLFDARTPEIAEMLIAQGVDVNTADEHGQTALFAVEQSSPQSAEMVSYLLKCGANPNARDEKGTVPLNYARDGKTVDALVAGGADIHTKDNNGDGVFLFYAGVEEPDRWEALTRHGAKMNTKVDGSRVMYQAFLENNPQHIKYLLEHGADPNVLTPDHNISLLAMAVFADKPKIVNLLRDWGANTVGEFSQAAAWGDLKKMQVLLDAGTDVNERSGGNDTPLQFAVFRGKIDAVQFLLDHGADINLFNDSGMTALIYTNFIQEMLSANSGNGPKWSPVTGLSQKQVKESMDKISAMLRERHPNIGYRNQQGETALCRATMDDLLVSLQLQEGANVNVQRNDGMTPLMLAIVSQPKNAPRDQVRPINKDGTPAQSFSAIGSAVKALLENGADVTIKNKDGKTAVDLARENGNAEILELLQRKVGASASTTKSNTAESTSAKGEKQKSEEPIHHQLIQAVKREDMKEAQRLMSLGSDADAGSALSYFVSSGSSKMVQWFIDHGVDPKKISGNSAPTLLFYSGSPEIVEILIKNGVDINAVDSFGRTALFEVAGYRLNSSETVRMLLRRGANPNARDKFGFTPLTMAQGKEAVEVLVDGGADVHAKDDKGRGVLHYFGGAEEQAGRWEALFSHGLKFDPKVDGPELVERSLNRSKNAEDRVKFLLDKGVDPNALGVHATLSLFSIAIINGQAGSVALLRKAGANNVGELSEAAAAGDLKRMQSLIDAGSDVNEQDGNNTTPLIFAIRRGQPEAVALLIKAGANIDIFDSYGGTPLAFAESQNQQARDAREQSSSIIRGIDKKEVAQRTESIIKALKAAHPAPAYCNIRGETALCAAAAKGYTIFAGQLLSEGMNANAQTYEGMTPLMLAIINQQKNASSDEVFLSMIKDGVETKRSYSKYGYFVKMLLDKNADLTLKNKDGKTALDLARENGNAEILRLLQAKG
ncbi:MAG: ankyrin repeat domain-containing protein [Chthoniobacterales bacterium]